MKITKSQLKQIIKEELETINEGTRAEAEEVKHSLVRNFFQNKKTAENLIKEYIRAMHSYRDLIDVKPNDWRSNEEFKAGVVAAVSETIASWQSLLDELTADKSPDAGGGLGGPGGKARFPSEKEREAAYAATGGGFPLTDPEMS